MCLCVLVCVCVWERVVVEGGYLVIYRSKRPVANKRGQRVICLAPCWALALAVLAEGRHGSKATHGALQGTDFGSKIASSA